MSTPLQALGASLTDVSRRLRLQTTSRPQLLPTHNQRQSLTGFEDVLNSYLPPEQVSTIKRAYYYAEQAHYGQARRTGEPYVTHPLAVATVLARMHMDHESIMAALLHDVIEDTGVSKEDIRTQFGEEVADLVDGVSKLTHVEFDSAEIKQAENFQKMALAMARDIRVILVKLADRLHNMRTLGALKPEAKKRIANETLDIYAPIATRLGMNEVRMEFEDLGLRTLYPMRARRIEAAREAARGRRKQLIEDITEQLEQALTRDNIEGEVIGREKHLYSIYSKMREKRKSFSDIMDIFAFRVIVDDVDACYRTLGVVHSLYKPVPGEFKDYIAIPKANGYQSLHTVLRGMHGVPIEIQIRTRDMEDMANNGIAAHWLYKSNQDTANIPQMRAREWVKGLLEMQQTAGNSLEFIESVKVDLFPDEVYVFTPRGEIMELPKGACAVDFAYAVHTDVGNRCVACRINNQLAPLSEPLESGVSVEIVTSPAGRPTPSWLNFVVTARARSQIRHFLKQQQHEDSVALGQKLLTKAVAALSPDDVIDNNAIKTRVEEHYPGSDYGTILTDLALGNQLPQVVAATLLGQSGASLENDQSAMEIKGTEGYVLVYAKCCCPLPGDPIEGFLSPDRGLVVHRENCRNLDDLREQPERLMPLRWDDQIEGTYPVAVRIEMANQRGMIATLATKLSAIGLNIERISTQDESVHFSNIIIELQLNSRVHLARVMKRIRVMEGVRKVVRCSRR
ncbi:MAG: bifunctional (p)ppGpp synthetase/guanosine-3',5'-bis(diphosphate) 3'-pyrophosphohydrolase [Proteobacteria bacterium]|nr:MAG: bifunctional (p)ppGpp synthetase/guanosine-3',5'-bis(diphosphate) 3'-pyrophosphohydrolase [Pseudomonadota bacterium]